MKIFCIGYNKTGTTSLYKAIEELGFKGFDLLEGELTMPSVIKGQWKNLYDLIETSELFKDIPFSLPGVWKKIYEKYPNGKYILSERDSSDQWYNSIKVFHKKIFKLSEVPTWEDVKSIKYVYNNPNNEGGLLSDYMSYTYGKEGLPYDKDKLINSYEAHNREVKEFFKDKENFITVNVSNDDDYQRLCKFLNKSISKDSKFPHHNKT
jgi:hypothetical protein